MLGEGMRFLKIAKGEVRYCQWSYGREDDRKGDSVKMEECVVPMLYSLTIRQREVRSQFKKPKAKGKFLLFSNFKYIWQEKKVI